jgi:hypothetical protein
MNSWVLGRLRLADHEPLHGKDQQVWADSGYRSARVHVNRDQWAARRTQPRGGHKARGQCGVIAPVVDLTSVDTRLAPP